MEFLNCVHEDGVKMACALVHNHNVSHCPIPCSIIVVQVSCTNACVKV